jgi:hypothetical protein
MIILQHTIVIYAHTTSPMEITPRCAKDPLGQSPWLFDEILSLISEQLSDQPLPSYRTFSGSKSMSI